MRLPDALEGGSQVSQMVAVGGAVDHDIVNVRDHVLRALHNLSLIHI